MAHQPKGMVGERQVGTPHFWIDYVRIDGYRYFLFGIAYISIDGMQGGRDFLLE